MSKQPCVLVVGHDRKLCRILGKVLEREGFYALKADDGRVALHVLEDWRPEIILLDLEMPHDDGWGFYHQCRWAGYDGPVVIIAASEAAEARRRLAAQAVLQKPVNIEALVEVVKQLAAAHPIG